MRLSDERFARVVLLDVSRLRKIGQRADHQYLSRSSRHSHTVRLTLKTAHQKIGSRTAADKRLEGMLAIGRVAPTDLYSDRA